MATVTYDQQPLPSLQPRHRSQSDSNLLEANGSHPHTQQPEMYRMGSVGDLSPQKAASASKKKGFLHKLVRPWKWKKKKRESSKDLEPGKHTMYRIMQFLRLCYGFGF